MNLDFFHEHTKEFDNCRIQCIRDLFLMYGKRIPYEFLLLLSGSNIAYTSYLKYKGVSCPVFTPSFEQCDSSILDSLQVKYKIEKHEKDDQKWMCEMLEKGNPAICYYSQNVIMNPKRGGRVVLGMISSIIPYEISKGKCKSNIERISEVKWDRLWKARNADVVPYSPEAAVLYLEEPGELVEKLSDYYVKQGIYSALKNCTDNFFRKEKVDMSGIDVYQGEAALRMMKDIYQGENERIQKTEDLRICKYYFIILINTLMRYMRVDYKHLTFQHKRYIEAIYQFSQWVEDEDLMNWYYQNKSRFDAWDNLVHILVYETKTLRSKRDISKYMDQLGSLFEELAENESIAFHELNRIVRKK